jgi:MraZ protein
MFSFLGNYSYTIDSKGRINIPADFRHQVPGTSSYVLFPGLERCIYVYPEEEWERIHQRLQSPFSSEPNERLFQRWIFGEAARRYCDEQGRIALPPKLLEHAGITREPRQARTNVLVLGVSNRFEFWNPFEYQTYQGQSPLSFEQLAEQLMKNPKGPNGAGSS